MQTSAKIIKLDVLVEIDFTQALRHNTKVHELNMKTMELPYFE